MKELNDIKAAPPTGISAGPVNESDIYHWEALIQGPPGTVYEGGIFKVDIAIPNEFPHKAPTFKFITKIYHPNVDQEKGLICLKVLQEWAPSVKIAKVLTDIYNLMITPEPEHAVDAAIGQEFMENRAAFDRKGQRNG
ncbi:signal peptidase I [Histomonas meleagridis]|uniref:signal peptidase I n=1 Tax=Histomonas meleagridis TaxID=135588 RepID=UPI0035597B55|nr:signal peptidase I [Histomonas meleagridis]